MEYRSDRTVDAQRLPPDAGVRGLRAGTFGVRGRCPGYDAPYSFQELNPLPYRIVSEWVKTLPDSALHFTDDQRETLRAALKIAGVAVKDDPPAILRTHFDELSYVWREEVFYKLSDTCSIWWGGAYRRPSEVHPG